MKIYACLNKINKRRHIPLYVDNLTVSNFAFIQQSFRKKNCIVSSVHRILPASKKVSQNRILQTYFLE